MTDGNVLSTQIDPETGIVVEFKGVSGAKVGYDGPHETPERATIASILAPKRRAGSGGRKNIPYVGDQHPSRSSVKREGKVDAH